MILCKNGSSHFPSTFPMGLGGSFVEMLRKFESELLVLLDVGKDSDVASLANSCSVTEKKINNIFEILRNILNLMQ